MRQYSVWWRIVQHIGKDEIAIIVLLQKSHINCDFDAVSCV
jgi:hypothetical protein